MFQKLIFQLFLLFYRFHSTFGNRSDLSSKQRIFQDKFARDLRVTYAH